MDMAGQETWGKSSLQKGPEGTQNCAAKRNISVSS